MACSARGLLLLALCLSDVTASTRFSNVLGDDMVLEASASTVWGWTNASPVTVTLSTGFNTTVHADATGLWRAALPPAPAAIAPVDVMATGTDGSTTTLLRVMFGRVVFCSGQRCVAQVRIKQRAVRA